MKKRKIMFLVMGVMLLALTGFSAQSSAGINLNIGINVPLPALVFPAPPSMVVIPGSYVYYAPEIDVNVLFYHGYWYRPSERCWYKSRSYNGPWTYLDSRRVPRAVVELPPDYRRMSHDSRRIGYGELSRNWGRWERERY